VVTTEVCTLSGSTVTIVAASGISPPPAPWAADSNYNGASASQSGNATIGVPVITWATPAAINYGTALSTIQLNATANITGTFKYTPASGKVLTAGAQTLSVTFTPTGKANKTDYGPVTTTVTLQVLQDATTTTATPVDPTVTLSKKGTATDTIDFTVSSYKPTGSVTITATGPATLTCTGTVAAATGDGHCKLTFSSAGTYTINASYPGDASHTGSTGTTTVTVNPY
jgi:hypothetical protein